MLNDRRTCGDRSATDQRLVADYIVADYTSNGKTVAVVSEVAIKISRREVVPRSPALWDRRFIGKGLAAD